MDQQRWDRIPEHLQSLLLQGDPADPKPIEVLGALNEEVGGFSIRTHQATGERHVLLSGATRAFVQQKKVASE